MTLWNKVKFRNLDYIGDGVDFLMNNTPRFQTNLGAVFTLGMIVAGLVLELIILKVCLREIPLFKVCQTTSKQTLDLMLQVITI